MRSATSKAPATALTPAACGFSMPAEGERHEATWLGWPHNRTDWPGKFAAIPWVYCEIVRHLVRGERVRILVNSRAHEAAARVVLRRSRVDLAGVEFFHFPTNRGWTRDFGPIFIRRARPLPEVAIARFRFNGWAKYPDWRKDNRVPDFVARRFGFHVFPVRVGKREFVLEGGAIDVNGRGSLLATEECLLDQRTQTRNPGLGRKEVEAALRDSLGVTNILWLGRGIAGDDTHGHVDDLCRFVGPRTVVLCQEKNRRDPNYRALEENRERLRGARLENGSRMEIIRLPMPAPHYFDRDRLPASYANFYVANAAVLVPTFNDPADRVALGILSELFPGRPVVGIHAVDLVLGLGTLHCLTQQQPAL